MEELFIRVSAIAETRKFFSRLIGSRSARDTSGGVRALPSSKVVDQHQLVH